MRWRLLLLLPLMAGLVCARVCSCCAFCVGGSPLHRDTVLGFVGVCVVRAVLDDGWSARASDTVSCRPVPVGSRTRRHSMDAGGNSICHAADPSVSVSLHFTLFVFYFFWTSFTSFLPSVVVMMIMMTMMM